MKQIITVFILAATTLVACNKDQETENARLGKWNYNRTYTLNTTDSTGPKESIHRSIGSFEFKKDGTVRRTFEDLHTIDYGWQESGSELLLTSLFDTIFVKTTKPNSYSERWEHSFNDSIGFHHDLFQLYR